MKIQISPIKIIKDALVVWNQPGPEVDIVMDPKNITFRENSIEEIYTFHVLDKFFPQEVNPALANWRKCLINCGKLFVIVDNFEYLARLFVGGDITIDLFNEGFAHPTNFNKDSLTLFLYKAGFSEGSMRIWFEHPEFKIEQYELVISAEKNE